MENKDHLRYNGLATVRQSYMTEFIVACPKCQHAAFVTRDNTYTHSNGKLSCANCSHVEHVKNLIRYRILIKKYCNDCGVAINFTIPELKEKKDRINIGCPNCSALQEFQPRNEQYQIQYKSVSNVNDPIFNLPLWLQAEVKGNLLWAYNRQHLQDIKEYVEAKLRER